MGFLARQFQKLTHVKMESLNNIGCFETRKLPIPGLSSRYYVQYQFKANREGDWYIRCKTNCTANSSSLLACKTTQVRDVLDALEEYEKNPVSEAKTYYNLFTLETALRIANMLERKLTAQAGVGLDEIQKPKLHFTNILEHFAREEREAILGSAPKNLPLLPPGKPDKPQIPI